MHLLRETRDATRQTCDRARPLPHTQARASGLASRARSPAFVLPFPPPTTMSAAPPIFTATSAYSLAFVAAVGLTAYLAAKSLLPKDASWQDRFTFIWLVSS